MLTSLLVILGLAVGSGARVIARRRRAWTVFLVGLGSIFVLSVLTSVFGGLLGDLPSVFEPLGGPEEFFPRTVSRLQTTSGLLIALGVGFVLGYALASFLIHRRDPWGNEGR